MRRTLAILAFIAVLPLMGGTEISGRVKFFSSLFTTENQHGEFFTHEAWEFATKRIEFRLKVDGELSDKVSFSARLDAFSSPDAIFGSYSYAQQFPESGPLGSPEMAEPYEMNLYEGYIKIRDFLISDLDFTVGKQRISWGTADKVNVVDNLNPIDFANFLTFDPDYFAERRPQTGLNFEYYAGAQSKIQVVWLLSRQYSPLPYGFGNMLTGTTHFPYVLVPEHEEKLLKNTNFGLHFSTVLLNTDLALSWYHGNFHLPVLYQIGTTITNPGINPMPMEDVPIYYTEMRFTYPNLDVLGLSFSGEVASVGFWGEIAYYIPENIQGNFSLGMGPIFAFDLFEKGYIKYVLGFDYTLGIGNGLYINAQFLHGFFDERDYSEDAEKFLGFRKGEFFGELENYLLARAEYKIASETVNFSLGTLVEFGDKTSYAIIPGLEFRIKDALTLQAGMFLVSGDRETKFGSFKDDKLAFVSFKLDF